MTINIDFDGTCTTHDFPAIGKSIGAERVLKALTNHGHQLILFTMRSDREELGETKDDPIQDVSGKFLTDAVNWFADNKIPLFGIQSNPTQTNWTTSPKSYAQLMIDDSSLGCPLKIDLSKSLRPFVDWKQVEEMLVQMKLIPKCKCDELLKDKNICPICKFDEWKRISDAVRKAAFE